MGASHLRILEDADVPVEAYAATRGELVSRGLLGAGALIGASAIPLLLGVRDAFAQVSGDAATIAAAVGLEQRMVFAYATALNVAGLDAATRSLLALLHRHEQAHLREMLTDLQQVAGTAPAPPRDAGDLRGAALGLARAGTHREILTFAAELEAMAVAAYLDGQRILQDARTLESSATVMAAEAQHLVVLRTALGQDPIPRSIERGKG